MNFDTLGLSDALLRAVREANYTQPTPIQEKAIPVILKGRDVLAAAQTGTGKTAAFTLPLLHRLLAAGKPAGRRPVRALVLTPTRELAAQVEDSIRTYGKYVPLKSLTVFGGVNINPQIRALAAGVDVLVATPGRLLDHLGQKTVDLSQVEILVLDEADRMLDMGFIRDIRKILAVLPKKRQNILASATFSPEIIQLAGSFLQEPEKVEAARPNAANAAVTHVVHPVDQGRKTDLLIHLISEGDWQQVLVFSRTKHGANRIAEKLNKAGIEAAAIHGNKSQSARTKALAGFKDGSIRALVATDIAARGLDISQLPQVVNYDLPNVPEDYVHRIGRTGRAGLTGQACSLVSPDERKLQADIERLLKHKINEQLIAGFPVSSDPAAIATPAPSQRRRRPQHARPAAGGARSDSGHGQRRIERRP
jgi:ATP-dependent RNA helicase RhlE